MRKQELLHVHQLLNLVRRDMETGESVPPDAFAAYDTLGVSPNACNRNKRDHEAAIHRLLAGIETAIEARTEDEPTDPPLVH
ncbi:UPF0058 family protein [Haloarchaeobius iranensis]|uniref:Metal-binding protein n=1 Tax=Haloarchaeobius iranensis TaxID=996166 RepID=A0A1G9UZD0_9EURY|nr:UPF0058 family protein [Haloarchaeobius iranensis]SDM65223.1 hypothetical protein SAMN05192554_10593 [Haloarchaeobius iranensis]